MSLFGGDAAGHLQRDVMRLVERWEAMSAHYLPGRQELVDAMVDELVMRSGGGPVSVVELGSGTGSLLRRLASALPAGRLTGIEVDPVLVQIHRAEAARRGVLAAPIIDVDLGDERWVDSMASSGGVSAVVAVQVLHYFDAPRFSALLGEIRRLLHGGGVFLHLDVVPCAMAGEANKESAGGDDVDPWSDWWADASRLPALADAFEHRAQRLLTIQASAEFQPTQGELRELLLTAGFGDVQVVRRAGNVQLTAASRAGH